jgi:hypothetical protein
LQGRRRFVIGRNDDGIAFEPFPAFKHYSASFDAVDGCSEANRTLWQGRSQLSGNSSHAFSWQPNGAP